MIEHAVQHYVYALALCLVYKLFEFFFVAEKRIQLKIVAGIVTVIGRRSEDRRKIDDRNAEGFQIRQLIDNALKVAAVKIVGAVNAVSVFQSKRLVPVLVYGMSGRIHARIVSFAEPVDENMVNYPALEAFWSLVIF